MCGAPALCVARVGVRARRFVYALCRRTHVSGRLSLGEFHIYIIYNTECQGLWGLEAPLSARKIDIGIPTRLVSLSCVVGRRPSSERIDHGVGASGRVVDQAKVP